MDQEGAGFRLFDDGQRSDSSNGGFSEPQFTYFNRCAQVEVERIRAVLERWFTHYPAEGKPDLRGKFRSKKDGRHEGAVFELVTHEVLRCLGFEVGTHPLSSKGTRPDFVACRDGMEFVIEATVTTAASPVETGRKAREAQVYDTLNRTLDSPDFFILLRRMVASSRALRVAPLVDFLRAELASLNHAELERAIETEGSGVLPTWHYENDGWSLILSPWPKLAARGKMGIRPIGMHATRARYWSPHTTLKDRVAFKASRYGDLGARPYVVAVNQLDGPVGRDSVKDALFGTRQIPVDWNTDEDACAGEVVHAPDGLWTSPSGPINKRVSAVLFANRLSLWALHTTEVRLYLNPWASTPLHNCPLMRIPRALMTDDQLNWLDGESLGKILGLPEGWPFREW